MKTIITTLFLFAVTYGYNQNNLPEIKDLEHITFPSEQGVYYKDNNNLLNPFEGTYLYSNGNTSFKIVLEKKEMTTYNSGYFYEDLLVGGYQYIEEGTEKINTLNVLNTDHTNSTANYKIHANIIYRGNALWIEDATSSDEVWLDGTIKDPLSNSLHDLFLRKVTHNGQEALKILIMYGHTVREEGDPPKPPASYPNGEFILIKQ